MQVSNGKFRPLDMNGQIDFTATREVLDVAVPAVLRTTGDRPGSFLADTLFGGFVRGSGVDVGWLGWLSDDSRQGRRRDEFSFALVPFGEDLRGRRTTQNARVDEAGETDARDVAGRAEYTFEIPNGFGTV